MEFSKQNINKKMATPTKKKCYYCGFHYPHENRSCPVKNCVCNYCGVKGRFTKICRSRDNKEQEKYQKKATATRLQNKKTHANVKLNRQNVHFN